jgi:hypothetical protein
MREHIIIIITITIIIIIIISIIPSKADCGSILSSTSFASEPM